MTEHERQALNEALISLAVSLAGVAGTLLLMRYWGSIEHRAWQVRRHLERQKAREDQAVRQVRKEISDMEHERWGMT